MADYPMTLSDFLNRRKQMDPNLVPGADTPTSNPFAGAAKKGFLSSKVGPVAQLGGSIANLAGQPEIGIPLSVAGGAASGSSGGWGGAAMGAGTAGVKAALPSIIGQKATPPVPAAPAKPGTGLMGGS